MSFWQTSWLQGIAADPASAVPGYILGGISWYAMPFTLATTMGLVAVALENTPSFPTYPRRMTAAETNAGLVLPYGQFVSIPSSGYNWILVPLSRADNYGKGWCGCCSPPHVHELHLGHLCTAHRCFHRDIIWYLPNILVSPAIDLYFANDSLYVQPTKCKWWASTSIVALFCCRIFPVYGWVLFHAVRGRYVPICIQDMRSSSHWCVRYWP